MKLRSLNRTLFLLGTLGTASSAHAADSEQPPSAAAPATPAPAAAPASAAPAAERPSTALPYAPSLDLTSMDKSVDPCTDFYTYSCGGWQKLNPIPADQAGWSVYAKLSNENQQLLWGLLEEAAEPKADRAPAQQKIGDYFRSCMDEAAIERAGLSPLRPALAAIAAVTTPTQLPALLGKLQLAMHEHSSLLFDWSSAQDFGKAEDVIGSLEAGGLGLPDRDYYLKTDPKAIETRRRYVDHMVEMLGLLGESPTSAKVHAQKILKFETVLAKATLTRVDSRDPYKIYHKMTPKQLRGLMPAFDWPAFFAAAGTPNQGTINVNQPKFFREIDKQLKHTDLDTWRAYLRWQYLHNQATYLSKAVEDSDFAFYRHHLHGIEAQKPRWKRCVAGVDRDLGDALGQVYVAKTFAPEVKARTIAMTKEIEAAMQAEIEALPWMQASTKKSAIAKLHSIVNKVGYPDHWRDYSSLEVKPGDYYGNAERAATFESKRLLARIGRPLDRSEWMMTPPTVNAYYDPQMNDINFPAGILQPPLFDPKLDDAPNYGNTGSTIGHELTHAFDDEGRQYDEHGNLRDWWTAKDAKAFTQRAACVVDQYKQYTVVDDIKLNSKLTLGEDLADLGGTLIGYLAWQRATSNQRLMPVDGLTPDQRYFVGMAQWACENQRPANLRAGAVTNPHSPNIYRVNGVVANLPEFARAFSCKAGAPMVRATTCKVW